MEGLPPFPVAQIQTRGPAEFERVFRQFLSELPNDCDIINSDDDLTSELFDMFNEVIHCQDLYYDCDADQLNVRSLDESESEAESATRREFVQKGTHCGKLFEKNEPVYSCMNCSMDPTCVLCARCFEATNHEGHDVRIHLHTSGYGCCDCGDSEAFKVDLNCTYHNANFQRSLDEVSLGLPDAIKTWLPPFINTVLDFVIDVFRCSSDNLFADLTQEAILKDEQELVRIWGPSPQRLFTLMLWNDESHSYDQVIDLCLEAMQCSDQEAMLITTGVDKIGRMALLINSSISTLLSKAQVFSRVKLGVTIRPTRMTGLEAVASSCLHYLALLSAKHLELHRQGCLSAYFLETLSVALVKPCVATEGGPIIGVDLSGGGYFVTDTFEEKPVSNTSFFASRASIDSSVAILIPPSQLLRPALPTLEPNQTLLAATTCSGVPRSRLDWIFQLDPQLWKSVRLELQGLFTRTLLALPQFKPAAAAHYAINYPFYSRLPTYRNPEPDTSLISYAVQLFTAPSLALLLATELNFISYLFLVLERQFTGEESSPQVYHQLAPAALAQCDESLYEHRMLRSILRDLDYFLDFPAVRRHISQDLSLLFQALHFFSAFQDFYPKKRKTGAHVAFEDQQCFIAIESAFHVLDIVETLGIAFHGQPALLIRAIFYTTRKIQGCIMEGAAPQFREIPTYFDYSLNILACDVASQSISFYQPLHWMLADLLSDVASLSQGHLADAGYRDLAHLLNDGFGLEGTTQLQMLLDSPIQTFVLSAQVQANLWVRNGQSVLSEDLYFRGSPKSYFEQCIFLVQHVFCLFPPDVALATLIDRYDIGGWLFLGEASQFDVAQQVSLTEDMFLLILHCVCERGRLLGETPEEEARRFIVQNSFRPTTFSKLRKSLPSHIAKMPQLNQLLTELCKFKAPDTLADSGKYSLKHEHYRLLNTHHYMNSRNTIDHAAEFKKEAANDSLWFVPTLLPLPHESHFAGLNRILHAPFMAGILFYTLHRAITTPEARSTLIDYVLQVFIVAAAENYTQSQSLWELVSILKFPVPDSSHQSTCIASLLSLAESGVGDDKEDKLFYVLEVIAQHGGDAANRQITDFLDRYRANSESRAHEQERERRRALAKKRRTQLMKDMNSAQASFVEQHSELYKATDQVEGELVAPEEEKISPDQLPYLTGTCILCQEEGSPEAPYAIPCLVQSSRLLAHSYSGLDCRSELMNDALPQASPSSAQTKTGFHVSSCGHLIHLACLKLKIEVDSGGDNFLQNLLRRFQFDPPKEWFSCPLCNSLNNAALPVLGNPGLTHPFVKGGVDLSSLLKRFQDTKATLISKHNVPVEETLPANSVPASYTPDYMETEDSDSVFSEEGFTGYVPRSTWFSTLKDSISQSSLHSDVKSSYVKLVGLLNKELLPHSGLSSCTEYGNPTNGLDPLLHSLCYTISMLEISDRSALNTTTIPYVFDRISTITQDTLVMLWNSILVIHANNSLVLDPPLRKKSLLRIDQLIGLAGPSPIVEEPFKLLVELSLFNPSYEILGLIQFLFLLQFVRSTIGLIRGGAVPESDNAVLTENDTRDHSYKLIKAIVEYTSPKTKNEDYLQIAKYYSFIRLQLIVFLRKVTLLFKAFQLPLLRPNPSGCELEDLLAALSLPDSETIFMDAYTQEPIQTILSVWCRGASSEFLKGFMLEFSRPYSLADLEQRMDSMYAPCDKALEKVCQGNSNNPALCLLCKTVICASPMCCSTSETDAWDQHALLCGGDLGLFLVPKEARILLKFGGMKMNKEAPYLDMHGQAAKISRNEGSSSLPLHLNQMRYHALLKAVLDHQIPHLLNRSRP